jgi:hypothetical protein
MFSNGFKESPLHASNDEVGNNAALCGKIGQLVRAAGNSLSSY